MQVLLDSPTLRFRDLQNSFRRSSARARAAELRAYILETAARIVGPVTVRKERQRFSGDFGRSTVFLDELWDNAAAGNQIDHRDVLDQQKRFAEFVREG